MQEKKQRDNAILDAEMQGKRLKEEAEEAQNRLLKNAANGTPEGEQAIIAETEDDVIF